MILLDQAKEKRRKSKMPSQMLKRSKTKMQRPLVEYPLEVWHMVFWESFLGCEKRFDGPGENGMIACITHKFTRLCKTMTYITSKDLDVKISSDI